MDVVDQWDMFLTRAADWIQSRRERKGTNRFVSIFEAIRGDETIWGGCGVYTTSELLFISGSFSCMSRDSLNTNTCC